MDTNVNDATNDNFDSASQVGNDASDGVSLNGDTEFDLASYLNEKPIPKKFEGRKSEEFKGGKKLPDPFGFSQEQDSAGDDKDSDSNAESDTDAEDLDLELLDSDSEEDTNVESDEDSDAEPVFEINVDGKKIEVKKSELIADAQKWRASTDKFAEASKMRKEADDIKSVYTQERETLKSLLQQYQEFIDSQTQQYEPDWQTLYDTDPLEYFKQKELYQAKLHQKQQAEILQANIKKQEQAELEKRQLDYLESQKKAILDYFPQWKNPDVAAKAVSRVNTYLTDEGFTADELNTLVDARLLKVAHKAAMYDKLVKDNNAKKAKIAPSKKTLNSGTATNNDPGFRNRQAQTANAREAKAWNDTLRNEPTAKNLEAYLASQWAKKK
jgi:hypothetical protein